MAIREAIGRQKKIVAIASVLVIVAVAGFLFWQLGGVTKISDESLSIPKMWYTSDDGKTWFADAGDRVYPFDHNGKQAYRCYVWSCDGGKTKFVSHLERLKPALWRERQASGRLRSEDLALSPLDVKLPLSGESGWMDFSSQAGERIRTPKCPGNASAMPQPVEAK
jgi:hypothetical protein